MIKLLAFDTFGTVTDWHTGVSEVLAEQFPDIDGSRLALDWRRTYAPALAEVESGSRPWTLLDELHREALDRLLRDSYRIVASTRQLDIAVHAWHVIPGWPDAADGIRRLKSQYVVSALSNGNVALLTEMAKLNGFDWDFIGGADVWRHYKPAREVYLGIAELMQVRPDEVLMVATHVTDLAAARSFGLRTAYIERPREWGPEVKDEAPNPLDAFHATGLDDLADQLGC
ncbi:haloacid dehalogenase type II [Tsukamurella sp. 8F]|uniref:haloacid dehalogenase type II n=1 Tax=unclassified Tsukamurella TaxID=2633480 RepID=UPI0023B90B14|nr:MULTISPECIES: haloacid dehalogenase type II [unclassified Tsukamurella]MDF0528847.1 haloacid dehalogenase type II [Tsukamurella sp. 8J]MDF0586682.1 haloacid dehalogenase type II [Tsukamurella sp. 8F]